MAVTKPKLEMWAVSRLIPYEKNAKIHTEGQIESLAKVIKSQGWDVPIVVDKDGVIIKGHGRRLAAIHLGLKEVPVICRTDMTPAAVKAARLSDNRVALTEFDSTLIKDELAALNLEGFDVGSMGFDPKEIDMLVRDMDTIDASAFETPALAPASKSEDAGATSDPAGAEVKLLELTKVLGFKTVPESFERALLKFQSYAESMSGLRGELAFVTFCQSVVTEIEARS